MTVFPTLLLIFCIEYYSHVQGMTVEPAKSQIPGETLDGGSGKHDGSPFDHLVKLENRTLNRMPDGKHYFSLRTYAAVGFLIAILAGMYESLEV